MVNGPDEAAAHGPREVIEPTTGRPILMAPQRQGRPFLTGAAAAAGSCPFCPGHEGATPPAVDGAPDGDAATPAGASRDWDRPGWSVRAFPNLYPACAHHEVIAEGADHHEQPGDLAPSTWRRVVEVWQRRIRAMEQRPDVAFAYLFKNVGATAGASIAHSHSQLIGLGDLPPRLRLELDRARALDHCPWCREVATAGADGRELLRTGAHVALVPDPPRLPYECWLLPTACDDDFLTTDAASLGAALHGLFAAVRDGLDRPAFNIWLHRAPGAALHWHFELQPRTGQLAGLELGGDMYINSVPAVTAAARLRPRSGASGVSAS
ncbi:MAG: DUF4921 family protein [Planctomycetota bacterium]